ncbi:NUDIX hydrolase [Bifidobacterium jacchi]|uniref:NUDIX hydrolase n=2 Tax=Bifidobacterium jacchi TaxID=2490545 RepID=A0A5N5RLF2_9BIFI|nr:NUDIX hydrolase [Bifidobacterium jacchi]
MGNVRIVEAAGAILYRRNSSFQGWMKFSDYGHTPISAKPQAAFDDLEVCVVHRPKYDDWSWPKGRLENNETHRHAAVREVGEETGMPVALGPYLGEVEYPLAEEGRKTRHSKDRTVDTKHILYWMAQPITAADSARLTDSFGPVHHADIGEIDQVLWVSVPRARQMLTHSNDRDMLALFVDRVEQGAIDSNVLLLVRHGKAEPRKSWGGTDAKRPITPHGAACAYALHRELACFNPTRLVTSPWLRCRQTLQGLAWQTGLPMVDADEMTEDAFAQDQDAAWIGLRDELRFTLRHHGATAVCMHRPVIGGMFEHLRQLCDSPANAKKLIASSPYMPTGTAVALFVVQRADGLHIIDIQKVAPLVY